MLPAAAGRAAGQGAPALSVSFLYRAAPLRPCLGLCPARRPPGPQEPSHRQRVGRHPQETRPAARPERSDPARGSARHAGHPAPRHAGPPRPGDPDGSKLAGRAAGVGESPVQTAFILAYLPRHGVCAGLCLIGCAASRSPNTLAKASFMARCNWAPGSKRVNKHRTSRNSLGNRDFPVEKSALKLARSSRPVSDTEAGRRRTAT